MILVEDVALTAEQQDKLNNIVASAEIDGAILNDDARQLIAKVITGQLTGDEARAEIMAKVARPHE